jgi:hypothetical protein
VVFLCRLNFGKILPYFFYFHLFILIIGHSFLKIDFRAESRTNIDFARCLAEQHYPDAEKIVLGWTI